MKKLRFFFIDNLTRKPIHGLRISGEISIRSNTETKAVKKIPLSVLFTNIDGYVSFNPDVCYETEITSTRIFLPGRRGESWEFEGRDLGWLDSVPIEVLVYEDLYKATSLAVRGISVESPDKWDFRYTNLANRTSELILGTGDCSKMIPQHIQKECFEIVNVVPSFQSDKELELVCSKSKIEVADVELLISKVCWNWLGYSLGKLANSFSLTPCEKQEIWIKAWRIDQESYGESTQTDQYRESFIEESMTQSVKNLNIGLNINPPSSGTAGSKNGKSWKIWEKVVGIVLQVAGIDSTNQTNLASIGIRSQKNLIGQVQRTTSRLSTEHRITVQKESSQGASRSQKRTLINQNQCHSQTTNLYEVVDNYEVTSCIKEKGKGLMVKYPNDKFTKRRIFCYRYLFRGNLLDEALESCLESIGKISSCCDPNAESECVKVSKLKVRLIMGRNGTGSLIKIILNINGANQDFLIDRRTHSRYKAGDAYEVEIDLKGSVCVEDISKVSLYNDADNFTDGAFTVNKLSISYTSSSFSGEKSFFTHGAYGKIKRNEYADLGAPTPDIPGKEEPLNICSEEEACCSRQLLNHFNCNKLYYNQIIWRFENPQERIVRFENCLLNGTPLFHQIINHPIAVYGQFVVFEYSNSNRKPMQPCIEEHTIVSLPTSGLFQETLLGSCNSCEEPDLPVLEARKDYPCPGGCKDDATVVN